MHTVFRDDDDDGYTKLSSHHPPPEGARSGALGLALPGGPGRIWPLKNSNILHVCKHVMLAGGCPKLGGFAAALKAVRENTLTTAGPPSSPFLPSWSPSPWCSTDLPAVPPRQAWGGTLPSPARSQTHSPDKGHSREPAKAAGRPCVPARGAAFRPLHGPLCHGGIALWGHPSAMGGAGFGWVPQRGVRVEEEEEEEEEAWAGGRAAAAPWPSQAAELRLG